MRDNLRERIENLERCANPIGSILMTFLTEENFLKQKSSDWVLCDGRSVANTKYHKIGLGENVPDCRGMFFRNAGEKSAPLGISQGQATALNGITLSQKVSTEEIKLKIYGKDVYNKWNGYDEYILESTFWKEGEYPNGYNEVGVRLKFSPSEASSRHLKYEIDPHTHKIETSLLGDDETRPDNITVNTFIRVN